MAPSGVARPDAGAAVDLAVAAERLRERSDASVRDVTAVGDAPRGTLLVRYAAGSVVATAFVDALGAWSGVTGAERALAAWRADGASPDAVTAARTISLLVCPTCQPPGEATGALPVAPSLQPHRAGGRILTYAYVIPDGRPGAGVHVARWRWTDSDVLVDEVPHAERR